MKSILEQLYNGEMMPIEQHSPMFEKQRARFLKGKEIFAKKLEESLQKEFEVLMDDYMSIFSVEMAQEFSNGFKLGARMMCEVFSEQGDRCWEYYSVTEGKASCEERR